MEALIQRLPRPLKRLFYRIANPLRRLYWFVVRPKTRGAKAIIVHDGKVLLARLGYAHKMWTFPGGGVNRGETFEQAAIREAYEEVGVRLMSVRHVGGYDNTHQYKQDRVECFLADVQSPEFAVDGFEITEAKWFSFDELGPDVVPRVDFILKLAGLRSQ